MKKCILMISVMLIASVGFAVDNVSMQVGLVDYYQFEYAGVDWTGGNDGTLEGGVGTAGAKLGDGGLQTDSNGVAEYMSMANSGSLQGNWTAGTWVNVHNVSTGGFLAGDTMSLRMTQYNSLPQPGVTNIYSTEPVEEGDPLVCNVNGAWDGNDSQTSQYDMPVDTWAYLAFVGRDTVSDGITDEVELYADGVSQGKLIFSETRGSGGDSETDPPLWFNLRWDRLGSLVGYDNYGSAIVDYDEVAIWSRAISTDEVDWLYNGGAGNLIPEPATMLLLGLGGLILRKKR